MAPEEIWQQFRAENECWIWTRGLNKGYGRAVVDGRRWLVHRWVWEFFNGPIPNGLELDHLCRVPACCNPAHLDPVTRQVNAQRGLSPSIMRLRGASKKHCGRGHQFTPETTIWNSQGWRECRVCKQEKARSAEGRAAGAARKRRQRAAKRLAA